MPLYFWLVAVTYPADGTEDSQAVDHSWPSINRAGVGGNCTGLFAQATWEQ